MPTQIIPSQIQSAGATANQVLSWSGSAWVPLSVNSIAYTWNGIQTFNSNTVLNGVTFAKDGIVEQAVDVGTGSAFDMSLGNYFYKTITVANTFTTSNVPAAGNVASFTLELTNGGAATITWMTGTKWAGGAAPSLTASGTDILVFTTRDGGTTWYGAPAILAAA